MAQQILIVGLTIFIAHFLVLLFKVTKIPDVLLLMIGGIVITSIALIVILFEGGVNLHIKTILSALRHTVFITLLTWAATAATVGWIMYALTPLDWGMALVTGTILGGTSSAVVVPMISALGMDDRPKTVLFLESAITDVLCIVVTVGLLQALRSGKMDTGQIAIQILISFGAAMLLGVSGGFLWGMLLGKVRRFPNTIFATVAYVFLLYGAAELLNISGAIAALSFGVTLANISGLTFSTSQGRRLLVFRKVSRVDKLFFSEVVFLLKTFFFIYLGISIRFDRTVYILLALAVVAVVYLERFMLVRIIASRKFNQRDASIMTTMVPKGLAAAVLAFLPLQLGLPHAEWVSGVAFPVILISIVATSFLILLIEKTPLKKAYFRIFASFTAVGERPSAILPSQPLPQTLSETPAHPQEPSEPLVQTMEIRDERRAADDAAAQETPKAPEAKS
jgi:cell volume regulation protein A